MRTAIIILILFSIKVCAGIGIGYSGVSALPVNLTSFTANQSGSGVQLYWTTATEVNNYGFNVERASTLLVMTVRNWMTIGFLNGHGNSNSPKSYSFEDKNPLAGKDEYRLKQIDFEGAFEYSDVIEVTLEAPANYSLNQNYPNPFNPETVISYQIPVAGFVTLKVYDVLGKEVATLVTEFKNAGTYHSTFSTLHAPLPSGIYFYKMQSGNFVSIKKMLVLK